MADVITRDVFAERLKGWVEQQGGDMPMTAARDEVRWFFDTLTEALVEGNEVRIHGFGTFRTSQRAARMGRNPRTGEAVKVAARRVVRFAPSTTFSAQLKSSRSRKAKRG
jgi:DNA-binding protein HU-beta